MYMVHGENRNTILAVHGGLTRRGRALAPDHKVADKSSQLRVHFRLTFPTMTLVMGP